MRPRGIALLSVFFGAGAIISAIAAISLLVPGGALEFLWRLNPRAQAALTDVGAWAAVLLGVVSVACASTAIGLWRLRSWGRRLALGMFIVNGIGDVLNATIGADPRSLIGIPIVLGLVIYLARPGVRAAFEPM